MRTELQPVVESRANSAMAVSSRESRLLFFIFWFSDYGFERYEKSAEKAQRTAEEIKRLRMACGGGYLLHLLGSLG